MKGLLLKLLRVKGIEDTNQMSKEEKVIFDNYDRILSKEKLTIDDFQKFLETQIAVIEGKWRDYDTTNTKKSELIPYHTVYKTLLQAISSPEAERKALEDYLTSQINGI